MKEVKESLAKYTTTVKQISANRIYIEELLIKLRKEVKILAKYKMTTFSREKIYNEIWENSTSRTAKKYDVPYQKFKEACEKSNIPLPTNAYWASISVGKVIEKTPLPESAETELILPVVDRGHPVIIETKPIVKTEKSVEINSETISTEKQIAMLATEHIENQYISGNKAEKNTYDRDTLYEEIWNEPITKVAKKYGVSDVAIHKVCKALNIPKPPAGYWRKIETGHKVPKIPLPPTDGPTQKDGIRSFANCSEETSQKPVLNFLEDTEKEKVLLASQELLFNLSDETTKLHPKLKTNKSEIINWRKNHKRDITTSRKRDPYSSIPNGEPPIYYEVSDEYLSRVHCLLDTLFKCIESLGGKVNDDLSLEIRGETVSYKIFESETKVPHVKTKEELLELEKYEKEKIRHRWVSKPQIRTWDYMFNGKLKICIFDGKYFQDTNSSLIETQLGNILIDLYEKSEIVRIEREAREEEQRIKEEKRRQEELFRQRRNQEIDRTISLVNEAEDFAIACKIRAYVSAVASKPNLSDKEKTWIEWANRKADWYDPSIALKDELLGTREHSENNEAKALKKSGYWW